MTSQAVRIPREDFVSTDPPPTGNHAHRPVNDLVYHPVIGEVNVIAGGRVMTEVREIRQPGDYQYVFGPFAEPIARVQPGETVTIHTIDAFGDKLTSETQKPSSILGPYLNP